MTNRRDRSTLTSSLPTDPNAPGGRASRARLLSMLRPYTPRLSMVVGLLAVLALTDMVQPWFLKLLIDDVFIASGEADRWQLLWLILPGMGLIYVTRNSLFYSSRMLSLRVSEDLCFELRKSMFEHLQRLSLSFYRSNQPGRIGARVMDDTFRIQSFIQEKLPTLVLYFVELLALLIIIYQVNWRLALASTVVLPLHFWTWRRFRGPIRRSHSEAQETVALAHGNIVEKFLGMQVVKGFSAEQRESDSFREAIDASRRSKIRSQRVHFAQKVVADLLVGLGTVMLLGYGAWEVKSGRMTGGAFCMFFWYVKMLYPSVLEVISGAGHLSRATASVDRVTDMLDEPADEYPLHSEGIVELNEPEGRIEFHDVSFAYDSGPQVLDRVSFTIEPGEHVAITGSSGSGKTTLVSLLPRFNAPTSGTIGIDGRPAELLSVRALRGLFGIVFQDVFLFDTSIYENLRYARPDATLEDVIDACRITGAHEFIERLPDGYYTRLGGSGELSRGQKQRITLARALVRDPRVLVIDEATASIDTPAAKGILESIFQRLSDRTVIMVTHDMELLDLVDRVICIETGRITYDGGVASFDASSLIDPRIALESEPSSTIIEPRHSLSREQAPRKKPRSPHVVRGGAFVLPLAVMLCLTGGCSKTLRSEEAIVMSEPRISQGLFLDEEDPVRLSELAEALDAMALDPMSLPSDPMIDPRSPAPAAPSLVSTASVADPGLTAALAMLEPSFVLDEARVMIESAQVPPEAVQMVTLPRLSDVEIAEVVDRLILHMMAERGYVEASAPLKDGVPSPPQDFTSDGAIARQDGDLTRVISFAHRRFLSQPPQFWILGITLGGEASPDVNPDLAAAVDAVSQMIDSLNEMRTSVTVRDLDSKMVQLSYVDAATAALMLRSMGVSTVEGDMPPSIEFQQLPFVVVVPDPAREDIGLIGDGKNIGGEFGVSLTPSIASELSPNNVAAPMTQLLVMYHPAHPEQFSRVRRLLDDFIDRPARQIFVEGMVLEISEDGLRDLGIEWQLEEGPVSWRFGSLSADGITDTVDIEMDDLDFERVFTRNFTYQWSLKLRTLIRQGKAEILSRPSVLTLNNRQSTIRVGQDIPIATSQEGNSIHSNKIAFNFKYLPTGILLNIRPRINEDGSDVSMLIDTIVSAVVPGADLEIRSQEGALLATAPTVSTRRVQTYARIRNNTPFIIGGLVSREHTLVQDKIPLLGDLPLIGAAFRAERAVDMKREVIIVLTPYVLPEDHLIPRSIPKDEDHFDSFGNELFRDSYRIRTEDVFDLSFLRDNERLSRYRQLAVQALQNNFRLADQEPFRSFAGGRIPGEEILVTRMMYEVVKRLEIAEKLPISRVIFFEGQQMGGYDVRFIERTLASLAGGLQPESFFRNRSGEALALVYYTDTNGQSGRPGRMRGEPIPEMSLIKCPDRESWQRLLWELNQPDAQGRARSAILLHDESDLRRLRSALVLKRIVELNGSRSQLALKNFSVGKLLLMPELKPSQIHLIDGDVARYFFQTEHYYAATLREIESRLIELDSELRR